MLNDESEQASDGVQRAMMEMCVLYVSYSTFESIIQPAFYIVRVDWTQSIRYLSNKALSIQCPSSHEDLK